MWLIVLQLSNRNIDSSTMINEWSSMFVYVFRQMNERKERQTNRNREKDIVIIFIFLK